MSIKTGTHRLQGVTRLLALLQSRQCSSSSINRYSREITQKKERSGAQAMLYALGLNKNDLNKAQVGVASMWYSGNPCNCKLNILSDLISDAVRKDNMLAMQFNTIGVSDAISMGTSGMRYSLPSRELIADSIESVVHAQHYDGLVCVPGCDKNLPGSLMAISRLNRPSMIVYGGSMKPSIFKGMKLDISSAFESYGRYTSGKITEEERYEIIQNCCHTGCGACEGLYTANTMALCLEALGMTVPNSSSNATDTLEKQEECSQIGKAVRNLLLKDIKPSNILTRESFLNAIKITYAAGGSSNAVIHLLACARTAGVQLTLDDFIKLDQIPVILNVKPHGLNVMYDLSQIGGTCVFIKYLIQNGMIDGDCLTVTGDTLWQNVKNYEDIDFTKQDVILPLEKPMKTDGGHLKILKGNLAPYGCLSKIYNTEKVYRGKAIVFDTEDDMVKSLANHEIKKDNFVIVRYQGESIGCPEMLTPTSALTGYFGPDAPPLATDGRYSGASHGILIAHLPDAYKPGNLTRIIQNDDIIEINLSKQEVNLLVNEDVIHKRLEDIPLKELKLSGYLKKFSKLVGSFENGYIME